MAVLGVAGCGGDTEAPQDTPPGATVVPVAESSEAARPPATSRVHRVVILGTSLTAGLGLDASRAYPALVQRKADSAGYPVRVESAGVSGETSAGALRRAGWVVGEDVSLVVIETGANDGLRGLNPDTTEANLRAIVAVIRARAPGAAIVIAEMEAPPNLGVAYTRRFRAVFGAVARESGSTLMPFMLDGVAGVPSLNQDDGIHPNEAGAQRVAENVWRTLAPLFSRLPPSEG